MLKMCFDRSWETYTVSRIEYNNEKVKDCIFEQYKF